MSSLGAAAMSLSRDPAADVTAIRAVIGRHGYCYLMNDRAGFDFAGYVGRLGPLLPQYDGATVWDIKPEPDMDDIYHSKNTRALVPHTEAYELPGQPPRYVALWCLKSAAGGGGETTLADGYRFLDTFSAQDHQIMAARRYEWRSSEGLARQNVVISNSYPILTFAENGMRILRFSYNNAVRSDPFITGYLERGLQFFNATHLAISIAENDLLVWDNWRMIHSRNGFADRGRHLRRALISA